MFRDEHGTTWLNGLDLNKKPFLTTTRQRVNKKGLKHKPYTSTFKQFVRIKKCLQIKQSTFSLYLNIYHEKSKWISICETSLQMSNRMEYSRHLRSENKIVTLPNKVCLKFERYVNIQRRHVYEIPTLKWIIYIKISSFSIAPEYSELLYQKRTREVEFSNCHLIQA